MDKVPFEDQYTWYIDVFMEATDECLLEPPYVTVDEIKKEFARAHGQQAQVEQASFVPVLRECPKPQARSRGCMTCWGWAWSLRDGFHLKRKVR